MSVQGTGRLCRSLGVGRELIEQHWPVGMNRCSCCCGR